MELNVKLDKALTMLEDLELKSKQSTNVDDPPLLSSSSSHSIIRISSFQFPLETVADAKLLEHALHDTKFKKELKERVFNNIGRNDGEVDGHYMNLLGNQLFTDPLLNLYTYKGIARGVMKKESFPELRIIMAFFQSVLFEVTPHFDSKRTAKYVQTKLLRHSGSRMKWM